MGLAHDWLEFPIQSKIKAKTGLVLYPRSKAVTCGKVNRHTDTAKSGFFSTGQTHCTIYIICTNNSKLFLHGILDQIATVQTPFSRWYNVFEQCRIVFYSTKFVLNEKVHQYINIDQFNVRNFSCGCHLGKWQSMWRQRPRPANLDSLT